MTPVIQYQRVMDRQPSRPDPTRPKTVTLPLAMYSLICYSAVENNYTLLLKGCWSEGKTKNVTSPPPPVTSPTRLYYTVESRRRCERTRWQLWPSLQFSVLLNYWGWWLISDDIMTSLLKKVMNIDQNSRSQTAMQSVWSVSKSSTESVGSRRELVANCVHTADADATRPTVASRRRCVLDFMLCYICRRACQLCCVGDCGNDMTCQAVNQTRDNISSQ